MKANDDACNLSFDYLHNQHLQKNLANLPKIALEWRETKFA